MTCLRSLPLPHVADIQEMFRPRAGNGFVEGCPLDRHREVASEREVAGADRPQAATHRFGGFDVGSEEAVGQAGFSFRR